ncbi:4-hydroxythreonine-4-phosphate dehydrogenase [Rhodopirellula maiorica SM1]|uniref:4-hydroxythreonine-4-phosphate dehydrogenase n=1 Tax=Rhodopirellula maiorica SM1 TaxID=1265738 RepID=M5RCG2_9BACT|nr:4-hydroxythreonine-4-phosphate dehydrogenase PdxA [Rhodopirellula maiorica]EMI17173.1 4-hydroxythreonine-4-phosphate dehydrogenase [Rhodopirellula maiorica SM1]
MSDDATMPPKKIAITVGDVAGIGPEIALKCASSAEITAFCTPILFGPKAVLERVASQFDLPMPTVVDLPLDNINALIPGQFSADTGRASFAAVCTAIDATQDQQTAAIVTGPIQKEAWHDAGIEFPGHTELLAARTGTDDFSMMLTSEAISCVLATIHIPLADVPAALTSEGILRAIRMGADALRRRLKRPPRIAVCGLNPHAGENGLFSHGEEARIIEPAIEQARQEGHDVIGPLPPDTAFTPAMRSKIDVYVCMYHDQGLIPLKALAFDDAVNVTLGLPIVRTSVDHGTAMNLAWKGVANHASMMSAIRMAADLCSG